MDDTSDANLSFAPFVYQLVANEGIDSSTSWSWPRWNRSPRQSRTQSPVSQPTGPRSWLKAMLFVGSDSAPSIGATRLHAREKGAGDASGGYHANSYQSLTLPQGTTSLSLPLVSPTLLSGFRRAFRSALEFQPVGTIPRMKRFRRVVSHDDGSSWSIHRSSIYYFFGSKQESRRTCVALEKHKARAD